MNHQDITEFLEKAVRITEAVSALHNSGQVHGNLTLSSIVSDSHVSEPSSPLHRDYPKNLTLDRLVYLAPEQTGKTGYTVDHRADLYSLGVIFYEMLAGRPPFIHEDPVELASLHLSHIPEPLHNINPHVPAPLSAIIKTLLSKRPEERYQTANQLLSDLKFCKDQLSETGRFPEVDPMQFHRIRLSLPQGKIFGRESEKTALLDAWSRAAAGACEFVHIEGTAGIGKTALVHAVRQVMEYNHGRFLAGKFDQCTRDEPYTAIIQPFRETVRFLLAKPEEELASWRSRFRQCLGENAGIICELIPEMDLIIGPQKPVPRLGPAESKNRFQFVFSEFIRLFCTEEQPLTLFIDDLHWADRASLELLKALLDDINTSYLLLITAGRPEEISSVHIQFIQDMRRKECHAQCNVLVLHPLDNQVMSQTAAYLLNTSTKGMDNIWEVILEYSRGNPFHLFQFLHLIYSRGLLTWSQRGSCWELDISGIKALDESVRDVLDLLAARLSTLPEDCRQLLSYAACIGTRCRTAHLSIISDRSPNTIFRMLQPAMEQGIIEADGDHYHFMHDRIQQAAYSLLDEHQRPAAHLHIAQQLLTGTPDAGKDDIIFLLADQFNLGSSLLQDKDEVLALIKLNLQAGLQAVKSAAFTSASAYFKAAASLLPEDGWTIHYHLTLRIYEELAEAACQCTDYTLMEQAIEAILANGRTMLDKIKAYEVSIQADYARDRHLRAVNTALGVLKGLGVKFPKHPCRIDTILALLKIRFKLLGRPINRLVELPEMKDPRAIAIMRIISTTGSAVYTAAPMLMPLFIIKAVETSINYGNAPQSAFIYATFGLILCGIAGDISHGSEFGQLALSLISKEGMAAERSKTIFVVACFIMHWQDRIKEMFPYLEEGFRIGLSNGDFEFARWNLTQRYYFSFSIGENLRLVATEISSFKSKIPQLDPPPMLRLTRLFSKTCKILMSKSTASQFQTADLFQEQELFNEKDINFMANLYVVKLIFHSLFLQQAEAIACADKAEQYLGSLTGQFSQTVYHFFDSLARIAVYPNSSWGQKIKIITRIISTQRKMRKWARHAPMNHLHRWHLVEAEVARVRNRNSKALYHYHEAMRYAKKSGFCHEEALACELAGRFSLSLGDRDSAMECLSAAWHCYEKWGAEAKLEFMKKRYGDLLPETITKRATGTEPVSLDMLTVLKASQAISSEVDPRQLPAKIMHILFTCSGAERGVLILRNIRGDFVIEGEIREDRFKQVDNSTGRLTIPDSIITFVQRTGETVMLDNAFHSSTFNHDPYIRNNRIKSACCLPVKYHGEIIGMIYLENNLMDRAFTEQQQELLQLLLAQAAISLQNARLFDDLKTINKELTEENRKRIRTEEQLRRNEKRYRLLAENVTDVIWTMDLDQNFTYVSPSVYRLRGFSAAEAMRQKLEDVLDPSCLPQVNELLHTELALAREGKLDPSHFVSLDLKLRKKDGSTIWAESRMTFLRDRSGRITGIVGVSRDISKRKQAEEELTKSRQELRDLSRHMQEQWEEEMAAVARDIHDELGQSLTALNMDLSWLAEHHLPHQENVRSKILAMQDIVKDTIHSVKRISTGLRPSVLDHFGLSAAVEWHAGEFSKRTGIKCLVSVPDDEINLDKTRSIAMFRILQEALTNVSRHAHATQVTVRLEQRETALSLKISDNGCGFIDRESKKMTSFGLMSMRERAQAHNGRLKITSAPGKGTTIEASFPF